MRTRWLSALVVSAAFVAAATPAKAVILVPGAPPTPLTGDPAPPAGTLLASVVTPFSNASIQGVVRSAVIREAAGTLTFLYQITNNSAATFITASGEFNFAAAPLVDANFSTNLGFYAALFPGVFVTPAGPSPQPYFGDRSLDGSTVGISFQNAAAGDSGLAPGGTNSNVFYLRTPNVNFTTGNTAVINGISVNVATFQPTVGGIIPEPSTVLSAVLGAPLLGLYLMRRRRARQA